MRLGNAVPNDLLITTQEAANHLQISVARVRKLCRKHAISSTISWYGRKHYLIDKTSLEQYALQSK